MSLPGVLDKLIYFNIEACPDYILFLASGGLWRGDALAEDVKIPARMGLAAGNLSPENPDPSVIDESLLREFAPVSLNSENAVWESDKTSKISRQNNPDLVPDINSFIIVP